MKNDFKWISFVSNRFSLVDRKGSSAVTTRLSSLGICFGVMTLIVVLSVMNGFQMEFIDSIIHLSSYHVQITDFENRSAQKNDEENLVLKSDIIEEENSQAIKIQNYLSQDKNVVSFVEFKEAQSLITTELGKESSCLIRALPQDVLERDKGFANELKCVTGNLDFSDPDGIILGVRLARALGVNVGGKVNLFALSGSSDTSLISNDRVFVVKGIFSCGYAEINSAYAFINLTAAQKYFGSTSLIYGIKLKNQNSDRKFQTEFLKNKFDCKISAWRDYNRSFFGALRVEKNILLLFVVMIFIVVAINIYNSVRKLVYERRSEISTLSSLGGFSKSIRNVFVLRGFFIGLKGSVPGLILGLVLSFNIKTVFLIISKIQYYITYFVTAIFNSAMLEYVNENSMWKVYSAIPARVMPLEVTLITLFGIFSCVIASIVASSNILKLKIVEVLHEE